MTEDRSMSDLLREAMRANLLDLQVAFPGKVIKYDATKQKADIQPLRKKKYINGDEVDLPVITSVPVKWPSTLNSYIHLPLKIDDTGLIIYCDRSLDLWKSGQGNIVSPQDPRHHDLTDAVFIPGLNSFPRAFSVIDSDAIEMKNGDSLFSIKPDGKFEIKNDNNEIMDLLVQLTGKIVDTLTKMATNKTATLLGPQTVLPTDITAINLLKIEVEGIKTKIETLKV